MRVPHTVSKLLVELHTPSPECLDLIGEDQRQILAEDLNWNNGEVPTLVDLCVKKIAEKFEERPYFDELPCEDRDHLLELISTNLPLEMAIPLINDEYYWKRRYDDHFGVITYRKPFPWQWKSLYIEREVRRIIEHAEPQYADEESMDILDLCAPYVKRLFVTQLQLWKPPLTIEKEDIPDEWPIDHINFTFITPKLPLIEEFDIIFGMNDVKEDFNWNMFKITVSDCQRLGKAILDLKLLKVLRIHKSNIEDKHCQALMQNLIKNKTIVVLDLSNCKIGDQGTLCIAKVLMNHPTLRKLILTNNLIGQIGAEGLGYGLIQDTCPPLESLILRLNPLGHAGVMGILRALVRCSFPTELSLSSCLFEDETPEKISKVLNWNDTLQVLDVSNNWFGEYGGDLMVESLKDNTSLLWLDMRETDITPQQNMLIRKYLLRNRNDSVEEDEASIVESEEQTGEDQDEEVMEESIEDVHENVEEME
ncbi:dynein regulatory complex subunit 5 [Diorhabda sublineata]|uniref:dynein regulatory complex subunit 5 n=1 Tax=Diorhabda sublineata TaxID=1163346 RepID=UPI0024E068E2|nr:dynein regulatory complex subunit 5 [Diorhabda sublineata]